MAIARTTSTISKKKDIQCSSYETKIKFKKTTDTKLYNEEIFDNVIRKLIQTGGFAFDV